MGLGYFKVTLIGIIVHLDLDKITHFNVRFFDNFSNHFHENEENCKLSSRNFVAFETLL